MIPSLKWYKVKLSDERVFYVETVSRAMAKIIIRQDFPSTWGYDLIISNVRNIPENAELISRGVFSAK